MSAEFVADLKYFQFLTSHQSHWQNIQDALLSEDEIGVVLRAHLIIESDLMVWLACASRNNIFFNSVKGKSLNISFNAKNMLARNFGLSFECYDAIAQLNKIRNSLAHGVALTPLKQSDVDSLHGNLSKNFPKHLTPINEFPVEYMGGNVTYKDKGLPLTVRLVILTMLLRDRMAYEAYLISNGQATPSDS